MGTWIDNIAPKKKVNQTWRGVLTVELAELAHLQEKIEGTTRPFEFVVTSKEDGQLVGTIAYGPVRGANKTDVARFLNDMLIAYELVTISTEIFDEVK